MDIVLHASPGHAEQLAFGVLLDDWIAPVRRAELDREARARATTWRARRESSLTIAGVPLHHIHELELYADVFLREMRVVAGLSIIGESAPDAAMSLAGVDPDLADCAQAVLAPTGVEVERRVPGAPPSYPLAFRRRTTRRQRATASIRMALGVPGRPRGAVLVEPYWTLSPVWSRLAAQATTSPVVSPFNPPAIGSRDFLRSVWQGGWLGAPGALLRRRSRRALTKALVDLDGNLGDDPLDRLLDLRCARLLATVARDTLAETEVRRRAFAGGSLRATLAYSDTAPVPRMNAVAAHEHGATVLQAQHGLYAHLPRDDGRPARILDGWSADVVAVWSDRAAAAFSPHVPGRVEVTGNPGAAQLLTSQASSRQAASGTALVLAQPAAPLSTLTDTRGPGRHLHAALSALEATGAAKRVLVRPHPLDIGWEAYASIATAYPALEVDVDASGPVEAVVRATSVCVGAASTATLQAAALRVPSVLLDFTGMALEWPFDGSGDFPVARSRDELADVLSDIGAIDLDASREVALEALGASRGAADAVADLVADAVQS